jgi:hypothetical protein
MFGLKAAPSYFQGQMATQVLGELLHLLCELFVDDLITWGRSEEEFLANLRRIFERLRQKRVKLHPDKCELGVTELEFVGHVINSEGLSMSQDKIRKVLDFELPATVKELRSFIGLCNYFSDHIRNCSLLLRPLHLSVTRHSKDLSARKASQALLEWTVQDREAFDAVKSAVEVCPTLFFLDEEGEILLSTDASDYGIADFSVRRGRMEWNARCDSCAILLTRLSYGGVQ